MSAFQEQIPELVNSEVVVDVVSSYVYTGTLEAVNEHYLVLTNADVHDLRDSNTTRERYILESRKHGVRANRTRVLIRIDQIVSLSALSDVLMG